MRASKLITISTAAVLMGGTSLALAQGIGAQGIGAQGIGAHRGVGGGSMQSSGATDQSSVGGPETRGAQPRAAEGPARRGQISGERGANIQGSRELQGRERGRALSGERGQATAAERGRMTTGERGEAMTTERGRTITVERGRVTAAERGRAITGERGLATTAERGRATTSQGRQSFGQPQTTGPAYGRATERNVGAGLNAEQRARLQEMLASRRDIPRVSSLNEVRINAVVPRSVRLAAVPEEVVRIYPRFRRDQVFIYRNRLVVVDPTTSRIVAVLPT